MRGPSFLVLAVLLSACSSTDPVEVAGADGPGPTANPTVTYYADVKPILDRSCVSCHQDGQIGVGDLTSFETVRPAMSVIVGQVADRIMPPWLAADGCNDYVGDRSLSDEEIATIQTWADEGGPEGDPADDPGVKAPEPTQLARIDHLLTLPEPYMPDASAADDYRCFVIDFPEEETSFVTGFGVRADNSSTLHHLIAYIAPPSAVSTVEALDAADPGPGYDCFGGPGTGLDSGTDFFGAWAPGVFDRPFAAGTGIRIAAGSKVVVQMHYNLVGWDGEPDQSGVAISVEPSVDKEARFQFWTNPYWVTDQTMKIPAGDPDVMHSFAWDPTPYISDGKRITVYGMGLHMHNRGVSAHLEIQRPDGDECLLDIPRWDFSWQFGYGLKTPTVIQPGDKLGIECHWDNSPENQPSVGGAPMAPSDLNWGDGTNDEMCLGTLFIVSG